MKKLLGILALGVFTTIFNVTKIFHLFKLFSRLILILLSMTLVSCATLVNDAHIPVSLSFSDGSDGECKLSNKRQSLSGEVPATFMVRRSDDALRVDCTTKSGKKGFVSIPSTLDGAKLAGSVVFFDLGITDSITDKHRIYPSSFVIPVK